MFTSSFVPKLRRIVVGLSLILAPLFLLLSNLLQTRGLNTQDLLNEIVRRPGANELSFAFALYGFVLFIPATVGLLHILRHRSVILGHIGASLLVLGMVSFAFIAGTEALFYIAGSDPTLSREAVIAVNERVGNSIVYNIINMTEVIGYLFGSLLLAIALFRAKMVPRIFPCLLAVGILLRFTLAGFFLGTVLSDILYTLAFASIGWFVLRQSDEQWEANSFSVGKA